MSVTRTKCRGEAARIDDGSIGASFEVCERDPGRTGRRWCSTHDGYLHMALSEFCEWGAMGRGIIASLDCEEVR